jgi:hypothetical protein
MRKPSIRPHRPAIRPAEAPKLRITEEEILADLHYPAPAGAPRSRLSGKRR